MKLSPVHRTVLAALAVSTGLLAAEATWLEKVAPVISPAEKKTYLTASRDERIKFEENFWTNKSITGPEYFQRLSYVDTKFGSGRTGSGANTDQGRVYLTIGPPNKVSQHPSSRIFVPMEIWYYDSVPGLLNTELRLIFFQKNNVGYFKLYSPITDTVRALLLPEAATVHAFGPNDSTDESDIRNVLTVPPAEDEIISAASNVATGIKYSGNEEILGMIGSPRGMLARPPETDVTSRLVLGRGKFDVFESGSDYGGTQADLRMETSAAHEIKVEIVRDKLTVYQNSVRLSFSRAQPVIYMHRMDLLPGSYQAVFTIDGKASSYPLEIGDGRSMGQIFRADISDADVRRQTPFRFEDRQFDLNTNGKYAVVAPARPEKVTWMIRLGSTVVWRSVSEPARIAFVELPAGLPPGSYRIEAVTESDAGSMEFEAEKPRRTDDQATVISFNANLAPALRLAFLGHQWLLRSNIEEARRNLTASLAKGVTDDAQIEMARIDALTGNPDVARERLKEILARNPNHFEALSVYAYVETRLQDYVAAAELYRRALAIQDSPALRLALAGLPQAGLPQH
ncbi:MAG TPA: GWxTD domain-containing protein [Bryobacteraceae bacterium]|jgi:GWxTD domain-containing protein|nr:GWxTD domain-containing protein [Bryobacteraceae bacterium]